VGNDQLVEQGGVRLGSEEANPRKLVSLNLMHNKGSDCKKSRYAPTQGV